jgi:hypothetical protein
MDVPSYGDAPFHCPPDPMIGGIVLDLPPPISVNKLRRINWRAQKRATKWRDMADQHLLMAKVRKENPVKLNSIKRFEILITLSEKHVFLDADNACKLLIDYLRYRNVIEDDAPKNMRRLTVQWGEAPEGCRVTVKPWPMTVNDVLRSAAERLESTNG